MASLEHRIARLETTMAEVAAFAITPDLLEEVLRVGTTPLHPTHLAMAKVVISDC